MPHIAQVLIPFLALMTVPATPMAQESQVILSLLELPFGQDRATALTVVQTRLEQDIRERAKSTNDPIELHKIRQDKKEKLRTIEAGYTSTVANRGPYTLAPISSLVAVGEGSGVDRETTTGRERWLLYHNDRLYGGAVTMRSNRPFDERVNRMSGTFGRPDSFMRAGGKTGTVIGVQWKHRGRLVLLRDLATEYGVHLVGGLDAKLWGEAQKATTRAVRKKHGEEKPAEDLLREILDP